VGTTAQIRTIIEDPTLTYRQRVQRLAIAAEEQLEPPLVSDACRRAQVDGLVCDLHEGPAPYRPRYLLPDYERVLRQGSDFLELDPAKDVDDALMALVVTYANVPSITGYPVWLGDVDALLEPYVEDLDDVELRGRIRRFWITLDRVLPDAFVHANIGPADARVGRAVLSVARELRQVVPNLTLKVDPLLTPDDLVLDAVRTVFECGGPHFVNDPMMVTDLGRYGVASCYNSLPVGGGSHTLVRLDLRASALAHHGDIRSYLDTTLPRHVELAGELIEARIRYLVERARFFEHAWLVREGLVTLDRMTAMFGIFGLAEAVDVLLERELVERCRGYGHDPIADHLAADVVARVHELVAERPEPWCDASGGRALLHSQAGIDSDTGTTAGTRVKVGDEPPLLRHLRAVTPHHRHCAAGISDVLAFDDTARRNPEAVVDVIRGAFRTGMRDLTFNLDSNDFIRITGYLVRRSDLAHVEGGARHASTVLGAGSVAGSHVDDRAPKRVGCLERDPGAAG